MAKATWPAASSSNASPATPARRHESAYRGVVAPRTSAFNESDVSDKPSWVRNTPRLTSAEIADMARFLCSDAASYVNGQVIGVNGGMA